MKVNTFDIDGVILFDEPGINGVMPNPNDIIITGRSIDEADETLEELGKRGIFNKVYFNPIPYEQKTRKSSGEHKARVIRELIEGGIEHGVHFEDDPVQIAEIVNGVKGVRVVHVNSAGLTELENKRRNMV